MSGNAPPDPKRAARRAGLRYMSDAVPGISRHGRPGHFIYTAPSGKRVHDAATLKRIARLAIPPAWKDVWIAPVANAHLAATGRDAKGRKQYRYHPAFAASRDADKYAHLAAIVLLLEETLIRIGNEDYARANHSFGLTTLRNRHVKVRGAELRFLFRGKSGRQWSLSVQDRRVARVIRDCQDLPGQHLFGYRDGEGAVHAVTSTDVNAYLREICGGDVSAKDFRTWAGTLEAARRFASWEGKPGPGAVRAVIAQVAERLGNTVAVCRKCYVHPAIISGFLDGSLKLKSSGKMERAVLRFLTRAGKKQAGGVSSPR